MVDSEQHIPLRQPRDASATPALQRRLPLVVILFLIGLTIPLVLSFGPLRISAYRLFLIPMIIPLLMLWLSGRAGKVMIADFCMIGIALWSGLALMVHHDPLAMIEPAGIIFIETVGAWLLARCFIRTPEAFYTMVQVMFVIVLLLLPAAVYEATTRTNILNELFSKIGRVYYDVPKDPRWGLDRVQGPFEHPILFGVFCGSVLGMTYYVLGYGRSLAGKLGRTGAVLLTAAGALSSGPLTALTSQTMLILWDQVLKSVQARWKILGVLMAISYVTIDLLSNRTPFHVFASYFAFSPHTAYSRINIWNWGTRSIFNHPMFGVGRNEWEGDWFMSQSIDMFWIVGAVKYGIPVWIFWFLAFFSVTVAVGRRTGLDARLSAYRTGYLISMAGFFVVGWTVHFWNATFVLFVFLLGSGAWLIDYRVPKQDVPPPRTGSAGPPRSWL